MRVLVADDDVVLRLALRAQLARWGYDTAECADGRQAWDVLQAQDVPPLGIIDWNMPGIDGPTLCRDLRQLPAASGMYVILLTGNADQRDIVTGLESGADDYITKPFDWNELRARLRTGTRIVGLQQSLTARVAELQEALSSVRRLSGLLPICAYCKRVRDDRDYWRQIEHYLAEHLEARFSHGICPGCLEAELQAELVNSGTS